MSDQKNQKALIAILQYGIPLVSIFVLTGSVSDPVNAPKLMVLGGVSFAALFVLLSSLDFSKGKSFTAISYLALGFISWAALVSYKSGSPLSQNLYGLYGRNTGFLTYLFLCLVLISASQLKESDAVSRVFTGFAMAVVANVLYSGWVIFFGDFIGWENPYGAILGTFGNPNFISSFLGMSIGPIIALLIFGSGRMRFTALLLFPLVGFEITKADSLQGIIIAFVGAGMVSAYWLRYKYSSVKIGVLAIASGLFIGLLAIVGAVGKGPFSALMAQPTVALREQYWYAAIQMAKQNPIFGVGMDGYGDWYRRTRGAKALISPGAETVTNVSHNVFLDLLAFGGVPLFLGYLSINLFVLWIILKRFFSANEFDIHFMNISVVWVGFQIQSLISINQIGLAVWGWLLSGLLVAWHRAESRPKTKPLKNLTSKNGKSHIMPVGLIGCLGAALGIFIALPPLSADMRWMSAIKNQSLPLLEKSLDNSYFSPNNSLRLAQAVQTLEKSNLPDEALKYAQRGVEFNPESTQAWLTLYYVKAASVEEKSRAKNQLISLDPLNPKWRELD